MVCAWEEDFTGTVIDYGTWPEQNRAFFTLRDATQTLMLTCPGAGLEGAIFQGLQQLSESLLGRAWMKANGTRMHVECCLIDANWGQTTELVYRFCQRCAHPSVVIPSHGRFIGAGSKPLNDNERKPGDRVGWNWRIPSTTNDRPVRHIVFDSNFWKSFIQARLAVPNGDRGSLTLFGDTAELHQLIAEHLTAEYRVQTTGRGRTVDEWKIRPERGDNHWLDGLVGCAIAASVMGVSLLGEKAKGGEKRRIVVMPKDARRR